MRRNARDKILGTTNEQAAAALLAATFAFLISNDISPDFILQCARQSFSRKKATKKFRVYEQAARTYEGMGMLMSAWFSLPRFLDSHGLPLPLTAAGGPRSIQNLVRASRLKMPASRAIELMRRSPSIYVDPDGKYNALKRVFFLPEFGLARAALVIERYLDTLRKNSSAHKNGTSLLLERNCHVPEIDLTKIIPILRDIKTRGTAFMDSVDGDIEAHRSQKRSQKKVGELGVLVFAWTRHSKAK